MIKGFFKTVVVGLKYFCGLGAAQKYFKEKTPAFEDYISLKYDSNKNPVCIGCRLCERVCPASALSLTVFRADDGQISLKRFYVNMGLCTSCGLCVEACPVKALIFQRHLPQTAQVREELTVSRLQKGKQS